MRRVLLCWIGLFLAAAAVATAEESAEDQDKLLSGMSIVGDHESPRALVIVPWKSSGLGDALDVSRMLDDRPRAVDREVFKRELDYHEVVVESSLPGTGAVP